MFFYSEDILDCYGASCGLMAYLPYVSSSLGFFSHFFSFLLGEPTIQSVPVGRVLYIFNVFKDPFQLRRVLNTRNTVALD